MKRGMEWDEIARLIGLFAVLAATILIMGVGVSGCAYKGGKVVDGTNLEIGICVPGTDWSINALSYTGGMRVCGNDETSIIVTNEVEEANSYFGVITMSRKTKMSAVIEPVSALQNCANADTNVTDCASATTDNSSGEK